MKKMMAGVIATLLTVTATAAFAAANPNPQLPLVKPGVLTVCAYAHIEPMIYEDQQGKVAGYEADVLGLVAQKMDLPIRYKKIDTFGGIWQQPIKNKCDVVAAGLTSLAERQQQGAAFTSPHVITSQSLLIRTADKNTIRSVKDLAGKKVGVIPGSTNEATLKSIAPQGTTFITFRNEQPMLRALNDNKIDAISYDKLSNDFQVKKNPQLSMINIPRTNEKIAFAVSSKNPALLAELNQNLKKLKQNGSLQKAYSQWFQQKMNF